MTTAFHDPYGVYVGRDVGGRECTITADMVRLYEAGTEDRNPVYADAGGAGAPVAPALLFHSEVYRDLSWYLPNLIGNLHAKQEWEIFHPFRIGDTVRTHSTVVERYVRRNRDYLVNEVLITAPDGRWLQRSRTHQSFLRETGAGDVIVDKDREKRADRTFDIGAGHGARLGPVEKTITLEMCQAFSGPHRNYHTDREMARAMGFPDVVVQGMMSVCFLSELMTREFGDGWFHGGKLAVSLVNVVWPEDRLHVWAQERDTVAEGARSRAHVDIWCEKGDGVKTIVGTASALR